MSVVLALAFAACAKADTAPGSLTCQLRTNGHAGGVGAKVVRGEAARTVLSEYVVRLTVLAVEPHVRVRLALSLRSDPRRGASSTEGDLAPVFSGVLLSPRGSVSRAPVSYECYPPTD